MSRYILNLMIISSQFILLDQLFFAAFVVVYRIEEGDKPIRRVHLIYIPLPIIFHTSEAYPK